MKTKLIAFVGGGIVVLVIIISVVLFVQQEPKKEIQTLDFTYDEINSNLKSSLQSKGISMSSPLKFSSIVDIGKYCNFFADKKKQELIEYCTSTELKDEKGNFLGNIHMVGYPDAPALVITIMQTNPFMDNFSDIVTVSDTVTRETVCDCWNVVKPGGYETIEKWISGLRDFHTEGKKPHSESKTMLASKHVQIELTTNSEGYLWELLVGP